MFEKSYEEIFGLEKIEEYLHPEAAQKLFESLQTLSYTPQPIEKFTIPKNDQEVREIGVASLEDKIVQKLLYDELIVYFNPLFSDKNYGFRPNKGVYKAIRRVLDFISRGKRVVFRSDIDDFFETIDHHLLLKRLEEHIKDKRIIFLIELFFKNGNFFHKEHYDHTLGIYQGDVLSPLLSNVYLDPFDKWLEKSHIDFVRYGDDFVLFDIQEVDKIEKFLTSLHLKLNQQKSNFFNIKDGFTFLGVVIKQEQISIDPQRLKEQIDSLYQISQMKLPFEQFLIKLIQRYEGLERYYLKLIDKDSKDALELKDAFANALSQRLKTAFEKRELKSKKEAKRILYDIDFLPMHQIDEIVKFARKYSLQNSKRAYQKQKTAQKLALKNTIILSEFGSSLGISKGSIVVKVKGVVTQKIPKKWCEHIIIQTQAASLSTQLIYYCSLKNIPITFIDNSYNIYAILFLQKPHPIHIKQLQLVSSKKFFEFAWEFVHTKLKNQRNYLKYLNKHHKELDDVIKSLDEKLKSLKNVETTETLLGVEGSAGANYWEGIRKVLSDKIYIEKRVTQGATDPFNSALNYGYAILYAQVQKALLIANCNIYISFLHVMDQNKPTLVFDLIEEFRTFVVDRTIVSMFNKEEPIKVTNGRLNTESKKLIAKNILEKLGSYTYYRKKSKKLETIIQEQAYLLARAIEGKERYSGFIGRY